LLLGEIDDYGKAFGDLILLKADLFETLCCNGFRLCFQRIIDLKGISTGLFDFFCKTVRSVVNNLKIIKNQQVFGEMKNYPVSEVGRVE
jgi:hypothetical protein